MTTTEDPFQLTRLANELKDSEDVQHQLPDLIPLDHDNPLLTAPVFDVEQFLLSRSYTSLLDLRTELRDYLAALKSELVQLINDDYEAFISLSTDMKDEGPRLDALKRPLGSLRDEILKTKSELSVIQNAIQEKLRQRSILREEKAMLHLLLSISESTARIESLLLISTPDVQLATKDDITRGNKAKHLSRVTSEYTQLLYHASKARSEQCVFVDEIQWRIDRIQSTLSSDLDTLFTSILHGLSDTRTTEIDRSKYMTDLAECLRTYDALKSWADGEDILRRELVRPYVRKTVHSGALQNPSSPILPHTPFPSNPHDQPKQIGLPPRTPWTPITSFPYSTRPTNGTGSVTSPYFSALERDDHPLAKLYVQILHFIEKDLSRIIELADKLSVKSHQPFEASLPSPISSGLLNGGSRDASRVREEEDTRGFEVLANVVWEEFGRAIMDDLGSVVFSSGRPADFRKSHELTEAFIRSMEYFSPSAISVERMRAHPVYIAFQRRWQLPVYFQLRWKEIVGKLEDTLSNTKLEFLPGRSQNGFMAMQSLALWISLDACWTEEVYIPELSHKFWRLTLQIVSRYRTWLDQVLSSSSNVSADFSPNNAEIASAESIAAEDFALRQCACIINDVRALESNIWSLWRERVSMMLPEIWTEDDKGDDTPSYEDALRTALSPLSSLTQPLLVQITGILTKRCSDGLLPVRSIPTQFRAMSNKRTPSEPSHFVASIFRPVRTFFGGDGTALKDEYLKTIGGEIFDNVCQRYIQYISALKKTEESLKKLKKGKKPTFSLFGNSSAAKDEEGKDEERIRLQMILDVEGFAKDAESLSIDVRGNKAFQTLHGMVYATESKEEQVA